MAENYFGYKDTRVDPEVTYNVTPLSTAPAFSTETAYSIGDLCFYGGTLYRFKANKTAGSWDIALVDAVTVEGVMKNVSDSKADIILSSASGSIASFPDGSPAPVTALTVGIEPVQDLHGQSSPWPAGGGKNLLSGIEQGGFDSSGLNNDATVRCRSTDYIPVLEGETLLVLCEAVQSGKIAKYSVSFYNTNDFITARIGNENNKASGTTFTTPTGCSYIRFLFQSSDGSEEVTPSFFKNLMVTRDLTASYSPYSNICPITGWTQAVVTRTGKNLFDGTLETGLYSNANFNKGSGLDERYKSFHLFLKAGTYIFSSSSVNLRLLRTVIDGVWETKNISNATPYTLTLTKDGQMGLSFRREDNADWDNTATLQLELGSSATAYESPHIQTVTIDLNGTRYGGNIDVLTGTMTVTHGYVDLGTLTWDNVTGYTDRWQSVTVLDMKYGVNSEPSNLVCSAYVSGISGYNAANPSKSSVIYIYANGRTLRVKDVAKDGYTGEQFTTAMSGVQLVYPLAQPITVQLSPSTLSTLKGQNHLWSDTGDTEVTYRADTKLYIQNLTQPTEDDMTANDNITANTFFMVGNSLYYSTESIASGDSIIPGTNCTALSLADALNNLNS